MMAPAVFTVSLRAQVDARGLRWVASLPDGFRDVYHVAVDVVVAAQPQALQAATEDRLAWGNNFDAQPSMQEGEEEGGVTVLYRVTCGRLSRAMTALQLTVSRDHVVANAIEAAGGAKPLGATPITAAGADCVPLVEALLHYVASVM